MVYSMSDDNVCLFLVETYENGPIQMHVTLERPMFIPYCGPICQ